MPDKTYEFVLRHNRFKAAIPEDFFRMLAPKKKEAYICIRFLVIGAVAQLVRACDS